MPHSKQLKTAVQNTKIVGDPFFTTLEYILSRNEESLRELFIRRKYPIEIGVLPTVLLHPKVDLNFVSAFAKLYNLQNEFGYLARTAIRLVKEVGESVRRYKPIFHKFERNGYASKKPMLQEQAKKNNPSTIDRFTFAEFKNRWEVYRYFVYDGTTALYLPQRA